MVKTPYPKKMINYKSIARVQISLKTFFLIFFSYRSYFKYRYDKINIKIKKLTKSILNKKLKWIKILTKCVESSGQNKGQLVPKIGFLAQNEGGV